MDDLDIKRVFLDSWCFLTWCFLTEFFQWWYTFLLQNIFFWIKFIHEEHKEDCVRNRSTFPSFCVNVKGSWNCDEIEWLWIKLTLFLYFQGHTSPHQIIYIFTPFLCKKFLISVQDVPVTVPSEMRWSFLAVFTKFTFRMQIQFILLH